MAFTQLASVRLEHIQFGHGPQRVLLIHGFQASARIWQRAQELLPAERYTTVAINNRGAGQSDAPPNDGDYGVEVFANDAFEWTQLHGWSDFTLVGHSLGGATVAQFAVDHPELLTGLVLLDPADPDGRDAPADAIEKFIAERMEARRRQRALGGGGDGIDSRSDVTDPVMRALVADIDAAPDQRLRGSLRSMLNVRLGRRVKDLPMPVLLMGGDADALIPIQSMLTTWAKYPAGTGLHIWHGLGHSPNLDAPAQFVDVLRQFIEVTIPARLRRLSAQAD